MNGETPQIEIFKPFQEAWDLMKRILFQPFDFVKWLTIGFAAFLANLGHGYGFNFQWNRKGTEAEQGELQRLTDWVHQIPSWIWISGITVLIVLVVALIILCAWLRARGQFIFIDCVVKNRAAIVEPWREFKQLGNSLFLFSLVSGLILAGMVIALGLAFFLPLFGWGQHKTLGDAYVLTMIILWASGAVLLAIAWAIIMQLTVPIMYRRRCRAAEGARMAYSLLKEYPGEMVMYCLFWVGLTFAALIVSCAATCATCCLTAIPYVGTVILLPLFVLFRAFNLLFMRQFGPDYDVWSIVPPPLPPEVPTPIQTVV